jgi:hypothetical protein
LTSFINIALIITSIALIASVILQNKGIGLGGLTNTDTGGVFLPAAVLRKPSFGSQSYLQ